MILLGMVLTPLIFTSSTFPYISGTFASFTDTKHVDGTITAAVWNTQDSLVGLSDINLTGNSDKLWGTILGTGGNLYIASSDNNTLEDNASNNGSSVDNSTKNDSAAGNESFNLTADNLTSDNHTADNQTADNQTADNLTKDNQTSTNGGGGGSFGGSTDDSDTEVANPVANFNSNTTSGYAPLSVQFTDFSVNTSKWDWDFGDGGTSAEQNPAYTYFTAGTYNVILKITNSSVEDSKFAEITVLEKPAVVFPPVANFSSSVTRGFVPLSVQFTDLSSNATQWNWNFGDGATSIEQSPVHTYSAAGNYTVTLTVSNSAGSHTLTKAEYIIVGIASSVKLTSLTLDGENSTGFTINPGGLTTNTLDSLGQIGIKDESGAFINQPYFGGSLGEVSVPLWIGTNNFTLVADGVYSGNENYGAVLFFDGAITPPQIAVYNSNGKTGKFSVQTAGTNITGSANGGLLLDKASGKSVYISPDRTKVEVVSFVVDSKSGTTDEVSGGNSGANGIPDTTAKLSLKVTPSVIIPVAAFSASPTSGNAPLKVTFTDTSTGSPTSWNWNFGDGASSTEKNAVHTYSSAGSYTVTLTASNGNSTNSISAILTVSEQPVLPVADFNSNVTSGYVSLPVQFNDLSKNTTQWNWDFGDGAISTEQNPVHVYIAAGKYTVTLTVSNANGQNAKKSQISVNKSSDDSNSGNNDNSTNKS